MADTDTETLPNGTGLSEEDERLKQRPADIDADVREMERRKRVEALMSSRLFREELERVLDQQMHEGGDAPLLQRIREMVGGRLHTGSLRGPSCVLPINDIRGIEGVGYEKGEKILRCKLAAVYRLVDLFGWTQTGICGQITARLNTAIEQVLTTPRGILPHEVTASSLVKVDMQGIVQDQGTTNFPVNVEGFSIHGAVHAARPDVRCVLHIRSPAALAVSAMKRGLLPLCNEAASLGDIAYHRVPNGLLDNEEQEKLVRALGPHAKILVLSSGGALCCGATLEEAFFQARNLTAACDVQLRLAALPLNELQIIDEDTRKQIYEASRKPPSDQAKWRVGGEEFEALMRMLDNAGFRTGYIYRNPLIKNDVPKPKNDVEVPPAVSSLGYLLEEEEMYKQGLWKKGGVKAGERTRWLNSPNVYQKVEVLETGTNDPRKITKWVGANNEEWVQDGSPGHSSTPLKIDTLQFVPKNTNPKEFKALQQQIKDNRRADKISAGPQSHILEGVTWDEAAKLVGEDAVNTHTGDHVVLMGAASKGIIQRGYQHNATVYSAPYARNPFDHVSDREIDEYRRIVERKQRSDYDTDLSESEALSAAQITSPASARTDTEDESRDEHRVLRIETKQAPVRSQPEVVLSDDFLNSERAHADRTKERDPNLLSDDEVFYDSPVTSSLTSPMTSPIASPLPPRPKVVRAHHAPVQMHHVAVQMRNEPVQVHLGTLTPDATITEAFTNRRDYSRSANFENVVKKFDSDDVRRHPKCKLSLNSKYACEREVDRELSHAGFMSSRSSLYSIPSIEWDGRCKSEFALRTRSLPRQRKSSAGKLYRTQSHSGFVNFSKDLEPTHFHLPKCRSCGATNSSYAWELSRGKRPCSLYLSVDNLPQKCIEDKPTSLKVAEKLVPVFQVAKLDTEFVESQEFTEDNYLGDIGHSFSSENQTVIEKSEEHNAEDVTVTEVTVKNDSKVVTVKENAVLIDNNDTYRAEPVVVTNDVIDDINNNTIDSIEGEYHSFTEDMYFGTDPYESPVKELVEKDIRDYSVPIDFYCDDYNKNSPSKSPKRLENKVTALEPILEESKSSYDDSSNLSAEKVEVIREMDNDIKSQSVGIEVIDEASLGENERDALDSKDVKEKENLKVSNKLISQSNTEKLVKYVVEELFTRAETAVELKQEIAEIQRTKTTCDLLEAECAHARDNYFIADEESDITTNDIESFNNVVQTAMDVYSTEEDEQEIDNVIANSVYENIVEILSSEAINEGPRISEYSANSTGLKSFDSTVEFEKYEVVVDVLSGILDRIKTDDCKDVFVNLPKERIGSHFDIEEAFDHKLINTMANVDIDFENHEKVPNISKTEAQINLSIFQVEEEFLGDNVQEDKKHEDINYTNFEHEDSSKDIETDEIEDFSIVKLIEDIEQNVNLNETVLTEASETEISFAQRVVESVLYYIFDRACFTLAEKMRHNTKMVPKNVVTVVDVEDILFTSFPLWKVETREIIVVNSSNTHIKIDVKDVEKSATKDDNTPKDLNLNETEVEFCLNNLNEARDDTNEVSVQEAKFSIDEPAPTSNQQNLEDFEETDIINDECTEKAHDMQIISSSLYNSGATEVDAIDSSGLQPDPSNLTNLLPDLTEYLVLVDVSNTNTDMVLVLNLKESKTANDINDNAKEFDDQELPQELVEVIDIDIELDHQNQSKESTIENVMSIATSDYQTDTTDFNNTQYITDVSQDTTYYDNSTFIDQDDFNTATQDIQDDSIEAAIEIISDVLEQSFIECNIRDHSQNSDETFVLETPDMNTAFEEAGDIYSRSSSPNKELSMFEVCTESPIKNNSDAFVGDDLSVLYEKDVTILGSPFVKQAPVISMSQTVNSGGMKYWLSFDDSLNEIKDKPAFRTVRSKENSFPTFYAVDFSNKEDKRKQDWFEKETRKRTSVFNFSQSGDSHLKEDDKFKRQSVLLHNFNQSDEANLKIEDSFASCSSTEYNTCESAQESKENSIEPKKKLIYDSRVDLHTKPGKRQYSSWPPFEDTLFYRIISKFRMSESFDPSDFENINIDESI